MELGGVVEPNRDLDDLGAAICRIGEAPLSCFSREDVGARLVELQRLRTMLDAVICDTTIAAECANVNLLIKGVRTTAQYVAAETGCDPAVVRADHRLGLWLRDFNDFEAAFAAGSISGAHLTKLRQADSPKVHQLMVRDQWLFLESAKNLEFRDFCNALTYWLNAADPDGTLAKDQVERTGASYRGFPDGRVEVKVILDPLSASPFKTAFNHEKQRLFRQDQEAGRTRTSWQLGGEALLNLITRGFARADGSLPSPMFDIVMSETVAEDILSRLQEPTTDDLPIKHDDVDGRCEFVDGTPLHPYLASLVMNIGRFRRHIFRPEGKIVETMVDSDRFPKWMAHILQLESRGACNTPGCDAPFHWLHTDHIHPRSHGGPTSPANGQPLCGPDNLWKSDDPRRAA